MATARGFSQEITAIPECTICYESMSDRNPKILTCGHTFCLECIQTHGQDKRGGDVVPCPICRVMFTVPIAGFGELTTNYAVKQLIPVPVEELNNLSIEDKAECSKTSSSAETVNIKKKKKKKKRGPKAKAINSSAAEIVGASSPATRVNAATASTPATARSVAQVASSTIESITHPAERIKVLQCNTRNICGVAVLGEEVFVAGRNESVIEVYNRNTLSRSTQLLLPNSARAVAMDSSDLFKCLYVATSSTANASLSILHRYHFGTHHSSWIMNSACRGLSVTRENIVVVTLNIGIDRWLIREYTSEGEPIRDICFDKSVKFPRDAVRLSSSQHFVVFCRYLNAPSIACVDDDGDVNYVLPNYYTMACDDIDYDRNHLTVDLNTDLVYITDVRYNEVKLLYPSFQNIREGMQVSTPGHQLQQPSIVFLDQIRHHLYIAEYDSGRVLIVNMSYAPSR